MKIIRQCYFSLEETDENALIQFDFFPLVSICFFLQALIQKSLHSDLMYTNVLLSSAPNGTRLTFVQIPAPLIKSLIYQHAHSFLM